MKARTVIKHLIVVADDLGRSTSVNRAVAEAHDRGIVTSASLMAGGEAFDDAVTLAAARARLSVGMHVTLCDGKAVLPRARIPDLARNDGYFEKSPVKAWLKYTKKSVSSQIAEEIDAQFQRLEEAGIHPAHVDCHHHLHMHPVIFPILCSKASQRGVRWIRVPREPLSLVLRRRLPSRGLMPFIEWIVFGILGVWNRGTARRFGMRYADRVYGLARSGGIDERYLIDLAGLIRFPCNELFVHPDDFTEAGRSEISALTSRSVWERLRSVGIAIAGYREICGGRVALSTAGDRL